MPLGISIRIDKNPINVGDIQTVTVRVLDPDSKNSATSGTKIHGQILDLSLFPSSSYPSKNVNSVVEQFDGNTNKNGEVSGPCKIPKNTPIGTPYIVKVALSEPVNRVDNWPEPEGFKTKQVTVDFYSILFGYLSYIMTQSLNDLQTPHNLLPNFGGPDRSRQDSSYHEQV